jgi:hypothetical protein
MTSGLYLLMLGIVVAVQLNCGTAGLAQNSISLVTVQKGDFSGVREPLQAVIRTQEDWEKLWKRHAATAKPAGPPRIDFTNEMVVGVFLGEKHAGGYEVEITRAERRVSTLTVYYSEKEPASEAIVIQALTQPYHLVKLGKHAASVNFQRERK